MKLITISTSFDMSLADKVEVIFTQAGKKLLVKTGDEISVSSNSVQVVLSESETGLFEPGRYVSANVRASFDEGTTLKSYVMYRPLNDMTDTSRDVSMDSSSGSISILIANSEADRIMDVVDTKVDKVEGKGLSTNDYTAADKTKLAGIETGAEVNVQPDWNEVDTGDDDYIKNKPSALTTAEIETIVDSLS